MAFKLLTFAKKTMRYILLLITIFLFQSVSYGQRVIVKKKQGSTAQSESTQTNKKAEEQGRLAIKYNLTSMFLGEFPISAEYAVKDWFTTEVGVGALHANYLGNLIGGPFFVLGQGGDPFDNSFGECFYCERTFSLSTSFLARARFFLGDDYFDGGYIGLGLNYRPYKGTQINTENPLNEVEWYSKVTELDLMFGAQYDTGNRILFEYYIGFGVLFKNMLVPTEIYDDNTFEFVGVNTVEQNGTSAAIRFGFLIGFLPN